MSKQTKYVDPHTVLSPKASVSDLHVIFDGGIYDDTISAWGWTGWSLATMLWDGDPSVGVRWNGEGASNSRISSSNQRVMQFVGRGPISVKNNTPSGSELTTTARRCGTRPSRKLSPNGRVAGAGKAAEGHRGRGAGGKAIRSATRAWRAS